MFTTPNRDQIQRLPTDDTRVTCLHDDVRTILDALSSLDIALSNRDFVSQAVSETTAHERIAQARELLRSLTGV